jgi:YbbR domain-containing protein
MNKAKLAEFVDALLFRDWGTKILAIVLALVVFIVTRDEIHRTFNLPLRVIQDPDRVLLTELPETVSVEIRGPWQRLNKLGEMEMGSATLDLDTAREGPLKIDPASIVMPHGVILEGIDYDPVDLRFDPVVERPLPVVPRTVGEVSPDYELLGVTARPEKWRVRGGQQVVGRLDELSTTVVDLSGATSTIETDVALVRPADQVSFTGVVDGATPSVSVRAEIRPRPASREVTVSVLSPLEAALPELDPSQDRVPSNERVTIRGPQWAVKRLDGLEPVLVPEVEVERGAKKIGVELRFTWAETVPEEVRGHLTLEPSLVRFSIERDREL